MNINRFINDVTSKLVFKPPASGEHVFDYIISNVANGASNDPVAGSISDITAPVNGSSIGLNINDFARSLLEYAPVTVFISDFSGVFLYGNAMAWKMTGYAKEELIGRSFLNISLVHKDYLPKVAQLLVLSRLGRPTGPDEIKLVKKDGDSIWIELRTAPFKLAGKTMTLGFVQDISDRKNAEETLQKEKDKASRYFDIAGVILVVLDAGAKVTSINKKGCDLLGYSRDELIGKKWFTTCLPAEFRHKKDTLYKRLIAGEIESAEYCENQVVTKSGQVKTIAWHNALLKDEDGNIVGTLSSGEDITDRKLLEEQLFRLSSAISFSRDSIVITDPNAIIIDVNHQALSMYGATNKEEMIGKHILELVVQKDRSKVNFDVFEIMEKGYQDSQVYNMVSLHGIPYTVKMSTSLIMSADSTPMGMVRIYNQV